MNALAGYFFRFATVGVLNTVLGYVVIFVCMYGFGLTAVLSNVLGYAAGLILSFLLNRTFTFRSRSAALPEAIRFLVIFLIAYTVNLGILVFLTKNIGVHDAVSQIIAGAAYFALSFILSKKFVFRPPSS